MLVSWKCKQTFLRRKNFYNQLKNTFLVISEHGFEGRFRVFSTFFIFQIHLQMSGNLDLGVLPFNKIEILIFTLLCGIYFFT